MKHKITVAMLVILTVVAIMHISAIKFFLYWQIWWLDIPMHFLGGIFAGLFSLWVAVGFYKVLEDRLKIIAISLFGGLLIGFFWEIFEFKAGLTYNTLGNYPLDTMKDIFMDILGALSAGLLTFKFFRNTQNEQN